MTLLATALCRARVTRHDIDRRVLEPIRWWVIFHLPRRVVLWSLYRAGVDCCGGPNYPHETVPAVPFTVVLERWHRHQQSGGDRP